VEEEKDGSEEPEEPKEEVPISNHEKPKEDSDSDLLDKWTNPDRPTSSFNPEETLKKLPDSTTKLDTSFIKRQPQALARPVSYNPQHLLSPEWIASPATMSPNTPGQRPASYLDSPDKTRSSMSSRGSCECDHPAVHPTTAWTYPPTNQAIESRTERPISYHPQNFTLMDSPPMQSRPRPTSYTAYHNRNRSSTKIASSRGLRNNSYPMNYSRPMSGIAPKAVAGENIENDMVYQRFADDEVGPPTPITSEKRAFSGTSTFSITSPTPATPTHNAVDPFEALEEKAKPEKKLKNRWSTIPQALKNFGARRRDSAATQEQPKFAMVVDDLQRTNLTEENLHIYEKEVAQDPSALKRLSTIDLIPTPTYSPFEVKPTQHDAPLPAPFAPWAGGPPSPAATADRRRSSGNSLSPRQLPSRLSVENVPHVRPVSMQSHHSHRSSVVALPSPNLNSTVPQPRHRPSMADMSASPRPLSRRNTPAIERTCILCKTAKPTWEFVERRITANCWHECSTCVGCLRGWVDRCVAEKGWEGVSCPECGEVMGGDDLDGL
jgi:hypothetical protein